MVSVLTGQPPIMLFMLLMIVAGVSDVFIRRIPNSLIIGMLCAFLPAVLLVGVSGWGVLEHFLTALGLLCLGYGLFSLGLFGGGDAKLMAVAGLWLGPLPSSFFIVFTALCGGMLAAIMGCWYMARVEIGMRCRVADRVLIRVAPDVPYGFAFAAGAILAAPYSWMNLAAAGQT